MSLFSVLNASADLDNHSTSTPHVPQPNAASSTSTFSLNSIKPTPSLKPSPPSTTTSLPPSSFSNGQSTTTPPPPRMPGASSARDGDIRYSHTSYNRGYQPTSSSGNPPYFRSGSFGDAGTSGTESTSNISNYNLAYQHVDRSSIDTTASRRWGSFGQHHLPQGWVPPASRSSEIGQQQQKQQSGRMQDYEGGSFNRVASDYQPHSSFEYVPAIAAVDATSHAYEPSSPSYHPPSTASSTASGTFSSSHNNPLPPSPYHHTSEVSIRKDSISERQGRPDPTPTSPSAYRLGSLSTYPPVLASMPSSTSAHHQQADHRRPSYIHSPSAVETSYPPPRFESPRSVGSRSGSGDGYQWQRHTTTVDQDSHAASGDEGGLTPFVPPPSPPIAPSTRYPVTLGLASQKLKSAKKPRASKKKISPASSGSCSSRPISPITGMPTKTLAKRMYPPRDAAKRRYHCPEDGCNRAFGRPSALDTHIRHHTGIRPYECPVATCCRPFSVFSNLKRHMIVHPGVDFRGVTVHDLPFLQYDTTRDPPLFWIDRDTPIMRPAPPQAPRMNRRRTRKPSYTPSEEEAQSTPPYEEEDAEKDEIEEEERDEDDEMY